MIIAARMAILRSSLVMKGYGFSAVLAGAAATLVTGAVAAGAGCLATSAVFTLAAGAVSVACRRRALLFLL